MDSKQDKQAAPNGFLMAKMSKALDKVTLSQSKNDLCWTCGKAGHRSPQCPEKGKSEGKSKGFSKNKRFSSKTNWQSVKPAAGEPETVVKNLSSTALKHTPKLTTGVIVVRIGVRHTVLVPTVILNLSQDQAEVKPRLKIKLI